MRRPVKRALNVALFTLALAALVLAGGTLMQRMRTASSGSASLTSFDKTLVGAYIDLLRGNDVKRPFSNDPTPQNFTIQPGESVQSVSARLQKQGLVRDAELFRLYVRMNGLDAGINAGSFTLRPTMSIEEIAVALQRGRAAEVSVTIPEGLRMEEIADLLSRQLGVNSEEFKTAVRRADFDYAFLRDLPPGASLEGYLMPDTYRLPARPSARDVIQRMLDNYGQKVAPLMSQAQGRTARDILTVASIVEREAVKADEQPVIASVYLNRLKIGMKLDADPTTQYALGYDEAKKTWWRTLTVEDYKFVDPFGYNTYVNPALPPGPIASPGLGAIQAVLKPATTNFFFFVANCNNDGGHQFSATFAEHTRKLCR
ncbi:MAG: endolytic transglycosylase MltG [Thermoflexales bacterium]|nr:endolytic transglycosylase MltG [Thermoflexales bacterium]